MKTIKNANWFPVNHHPLETPKVKNLDPLTFKVYIYLCKHSNYYADYDGWFQTGERYLAEMIGIARNTFRVHRRKLADLGLIKVAINSRARYKIVV